MLKINQTKKFNLKNIIKIVTKNKTTIEQKRQNKIFLTNNETKSI